MQDERPDGSAETSGAPLRKMDRLVVGLTGGLATGKSTAARRFAELGALVVDADAIAREVVEPGKPALKEIVERFGPQYVDEKGRLKRAELGKLVFADAAARRDLENIVHPRIREGMRERLERAEPGSVVILDVPLLFESQVVRDWVELTVVVYADRETQLRRLEARDGFSREEAERRLAAQWPTARKLSLADFAIYNQADLASLVRQVDDVWDLLQARLHGASREQAGSR